MEQKPVIYQNTLEIEAKSVVQGILCLFIHRTAPSTETSNGFNFQQGFHQNVPQSPQFMHGSPFAVSATLFIL